MALLGCGHSRRVVATEREHGVHSAPPTASAAGGQGKPCGADGDCLRGCGSGDLKACTELSIRRLQGRTTVLSTQEAESRLKVACGAGLSKACAWLAEAYRTGLEGISVNGPEAVRLWELACSQGDGRSCYYASKALGEGDLGVPQQVEHALALARRGCSNSGGAGCTAVGVHHEKGLGTPVNIASAIHHYTLGCAQEDWIGCYNLAEIYDTGRPTVGIDHGQAVPLYEKACTGGHLDACNNLGHLLARSATFPNDPKRAFQLFMRSCKGGLAVGCGSVGEPYEDGIGVAPNQAQAVQWQRRSCEMGHDNACKRLLANEADD